MAAAGPDVAQAEHRGSVGDDCNGVPFDGQPAGVGRALGDGHADPGHARCVGAGQVVAVLERDLRDDLDLPAQMQEKGSVRHLADTYSGEFGDGLGDLIGVGRVTRHVDDDGRWGGFDDVQRGE
jgi:hypothetical protein